MKVLQLCYKVPFPQHDGGSYSMYNSALNLLNAGFKVKTLAMNTSRDWVETKDIYNEFQQHTQFEEVYTDTRIKPLRAFFNLFKKESYFVERFYSPTFEEKLSELLLRNHYDVVILEHLYLCPYIDIIRASSDAKIVLRAQNIEHRIWEKYIGGLKNPFKRLFLQLAAQRLKKYECQVASQLDGIIALTTIDAGFFKHVTSNVPVTEIPVGFIQSEEPGLSEKNKAEKLPVLFHLGSMDWRPNIEGIDWFIDHVLPHIVKKYPAIKFHLAGKKMPDWYYQTGNKNLIVDGRVKSSREYMKDKDILIVPLLSGGGIRVKIIEAMAYGKTVISTTAGTKGIILQHNKHVLIGNTAEEFANQVIRCIESKELRESLADNGYQLVQENYHADALSQKLESFLKQVVRTVELPETVSLEPVLHYKVG